MIAGERMFLAAHAPRHPGKRACRMLPGKLPKTEIVLKIILTAPFAYSKDKLNYLRKIL